MIQGGQAAHAVFRKDVEETYAHVERRVRENKAAAIAEGFNIPDGPPPEHLTPVGPGTEGLDLEEVREALQARWDIFNSLSKDLQEALKTKSLEEVNKVLVELPAVEAERIVGLLDMGGIVYFDEQGIVDETGKGKKVDYSTFSLRRFFHLYVYHLNDTETEN
jgi:cell division cycle protein 37